MLNRFVASSALLAAIIASHANAAPGEPQAVRAFVQSFYDSYAALASGTHNSSPLEMILARRASVLAPELYRALKADDDAQRKVPDDVVGLDFDPILNTQEEAGHYVVGRITPGHGTFAVEIRERGSKEPDVIAEVGRYAGKFVFVDFMYPEQGDLLGILRTLATQRAQSSPRGR